MTTLSPEVQLRALEAVLSVASLQKLPFIDQMFRRSTGERIGNRE